MRGVGRLHRSPGQRGEPRRAGGVIRMTVRQQDSRHPPVTRDRLGVHPAQMVLVVGSGIHHHDGGRARLGDQPGVGAIQRHRRRVRREQAGRPGRTVPVDARGRRGQGRSSRAWREVQPHPSVLDDHLGQPGGDDLAAGQDGGQAGMPGEFAQGHRGRRQQRDLADLGGLQRRRGPHPGSRLGFPGIRVIREALRRRRGRLPGRQGRGKEPGVEAPRRDLRGNPAGPRGEQIGAEDQAPAAEHLGERSGTGQQGVPVGGQGGAVAGQLVL